MNNPYIPYVILYLGFGIWGYESLSCLDWSSIALWRTGFRPQIPIPNPIPGRSRARS
jgi:hypothetical protein